MTQFSYTVTHDPGGTPVDITEFIERIEVVDIGTGEVRNAKIRVNAQFGRFITNDFGGTLPILDEYQKIRIQITDENSNDLDMTFEIDNLKPLQNTQQGTIQEVEMLAQEHHLMRVPFARQFFFESAFVAMRDIMDFYNDPNSANAGNGQPIVSGQSASFDDGGGNDMPKTTANDYVFNITELKIYDGAIQVSDRMGSSVAAGGAGDFFDLTYVTDFNDSTFNTIGIQAFSSGNHPDQPLPIPTITDSLSVNPGEEEGGIEATKGTVTGTWGTDSFGTLPRQNSDFQGALEAWGLFPAHDPNLEYPFESIVLIPSTTDSQGDKEHFKVNNVNGTATQPPSVDWDQYFFTDFLDNEVGMVVREYSKWTNGVGGAGFGDSLWKNCMANPQNTGTGTGTPSFSDLAAWDSNLVVTDGTRFRTWTNVRAVDIAAIPGQFFYTGVATLGNLFRGFRILVDTSIGVPVAPLDNAAFANNVVQIDASGNVVLHRTMVDDSLCAVRGEANSPDDGARVFQLQSGTWTDVTGEKQFNDCFHPVAFVSNTQGFNDKDDGAGGNFGLLSAVRFEYRMSIGDSANALTNQPRYYRTGAWACFEVPFAPNRYNGVAEIGEEYGDGQVGFPKKEPATLDTNNMHFTSRGEIGFNNINAEDLGPLDEIMFKTRFQFRQQIDGSGELIPRGNFPCRCTCYDTSDNVVTHDFTIAFNNLYEEIRLPLRDFQIYRARAPWSLGDLGQNIFLQTLEILNVFEWKNLKLMSFQWTAPYDEQGRYASWLQKGEIFPTIEEILQQPSLLLVTNFNIKWDFDLFQLTKPLLSITDPITAVGERALFPDFFEEPFISNKFQLDQSNLSKLEISQFRHQQFDVITTGRLDLPFGYSFFLENSFLVNRADRDAVPENANNGDPNTIKLVVKRAIHVIDKPPTGPGGFLTTFTGVKRLDS
jgi:hypothetical protein